MKKSVRRQRDTFNEINITPLTDIFLVLLIIMMVVAPLLDQQGLKLSVPTIKQADKQTKESKIIVVNISEKNTFSINGKNITGDVLQSTFAELKKTKKDGLLIQSAGKAKHGAVVKVMNSARNAGIESISLIEK